MSMVTSSFLHFQGTIPCCVYSCFLLPAGKRKEQPFSQKQLLLVDIFNCYIRNCLPANRELWCYYRLSFFIK